MGPYMYVTKSDDDNWSLLNTTKDAAACALDLPTSVYLNSIIADIAECFNSE